MAEVALADRHSTALLAAVVVAVKLLFPPMEQVAEEGSLAQPFLMALREILTLHLLMVSLGQMRLLALRGLAALEEMVTQPQQASAATAAFPAAALAEAVLPSRAARQAQAVQEAAAWSS